ncbi:D-galactonate transporter [Aquicella siphonis]|uniref:Lysosomal dipeptide transporter MFSD1 n=1 Tax=Aquicella siphonis TaxID=254247 RepID=A0A5E4PIP4_9COXI|nr:MFS transporter [Aquicella siphonis]VVC76814.1 D-galactonate transporter [Aquicella siphonis]
MSDRHTHEKTVHTRLAWIVTLTASLFFFYEFIQMNLFNAINEQLREAYHLDAVQLGQLFSMYFYANFICLFPAGNLLDRFSTRKILIFAISLCTLGTFIFSMASTYWVAAAGRFMVGAGASFCFLSCIRIASRWFAPRRMAFVTGVVVTMAMLGGLVAQTPFEWLTQYLGSWRHALYVNTGLGVVILLVTILIVQDRPPDAQEEAKTDHLQLKELGLWRCIKLAALNPQNWLGGFYTALINLPVFVLGGLWGILYLTQVHHVSHEQASYATTLFFVGVIAGSLLYGWISDHIERRVIPMIAGAVLSLVVMGILMYAPGLSIWSLVFLFFLIGLVTSSQVLTYPLIAELNPIYLTSTSVSIDSLCIMASGFIIPPFFGWLMERSGTHEMINGVSIYTAADFNQAMLIMPVAFVAALIITFFMRETFCRSQA